nr:integrase, catalytic region, zinc finger, CCHC-type, peptidase aspartic, catalytic [Tanacetum cinerariifolium]
MSTQQDIDASGSENRPPMLNKNNYVSWSSRLLRYAKSRANEKLIYNSIMNFLYVRRMIYEPSEPVHEVPVNETFHEHTDEELVKKELKQEIWLRIQQMMKGSDIGIQEKKAKLFNEWKRFTSTDGESIESYYHHFSKLMNDFKRNKHFSEKIASNLKFLNNLQQEGSPHVTIVHQPKDLHIVDYTQLYDFLKYNQKEVDDLRAERLAKTHDPLALMANSNNPFNYLVFYPDQPSPNPTIAMNIAFVLMAKAFKLNYSTPTNNNQRISSNPRNMQIAQSGMNMRQDRQIQIVRGNGCSECSSESRCSECWKSEWDIVVSRIANQNPNRNGNFVTARAEGITNENNGDLDEIEEFNANCILMTNLQQASTSGTQTDKAPVYDSNGSAKTELERTKERFENSFIKNRNEYAKLWNDLYKNVKNANTTKFVTSNSVPTPQESKVMENANLIASGMFRINLFKTSREEKFVPNKPIRIKLITVSQPYVITKKDVNSDSNGLSSTRVDKTAKTKRPRPRSNTKNDRVPSASKSSCSKNKEVKVEEHPRNLLLFKNKKHMSSECNNIKLAIQNDKSEVVCAMYLGCSKHMTGNLKLLINFVWKFLGTVYFVEGLGHNLFSVGQFYDSDLEVAFRRNTCFVNNLEGVDLLKGNRTTNLYTIDLHEMVSASLICLVARATSTESWLWHQRLSCLNFETMNDLAKNDLVVERRNRTLVEAARTMLIFSRALLFLWDEAIATAVYNRRKKKIMETMNVTFNELSAMAFEQRSTKPGLQSMTSGQISSRLDLTYALLTITTQKPIERELDLLFEAMYDDYIGGQPLAATRTAPAAQEPQVLQTLTASTTIAYTTPTLTNSSSQATNILNTSQDVDELETKQQHVSNAMLDGNTFVKPFATPSTSAVESSSSPYVDPSNMHMFYQLTLANICGLRITPLEQVIEEPSQPILTRNQL